jgi:hypothetical protein
MYHVFFIDKETVAKDILASWLMVLPEPSSPSEF